MDLSILIVSYNTRELTLACLESVYAQTRCVTFETIVVDNRSSDGSAAVIAQRFPQVKLIASQKNLGFAGATNLAARHAQGDRLLLLNPDTMILDAAIDRAVSFADSLKTDAIVGGRTFFADGRLNFSSCHGRPTLWSLTCLGIGLSSVFRRSKLFDPESLGSWPRNSVRKVDAVTGCFLLIGRSAWESLGGFDETFFMYGEETDLCIRAARCGLTCVLCPDAKLIHHGGSSERVRADKMLKVFAAKAALMRKHWHPAAAWYGVRMLDMWCLTRLAAFGVLRHVHPRSSAAYATWRDIWNRRAEYRDAHVTARCDNRPVRALAGQTMDELAPQKL